MDTTTESKIKEIKSILNEEQNEVFDKLNKFIESDKSMFTLSGYAGTGKTFLISRFIEVLENKRIAMTAPTNKAVKVLIENKSSQLKGVSFSTIHKLLGLRLKWVYQKGKKPFQTLVAAYGKRNKIADYDLLIVDEVSMLDDKLFIMLYNAVKNNSKLKIIFMGDPAQIPPVNRQDSIPLLSNERTKFNIEFAELKKIMRQNKESGILKTAFQIRNNRYSKTDTILSRKNNKDIYFLASQKEEDKLLFINEMLNKFNSNSFKEDSNYVKVIAWRNITVDKFNQLIRQSLFGKNLKYIMEGERLIADTSIFDNDEILFNTSDEFNVINVEEDSMEVELPTVTNKKDIYEMDLGYNINDKKGRIINLHFWKTTVKGENENSVPVQISILDPKSYKPHTWLLSAFIKKKEFDKFEEWSEKFAKVKYNYCITSHKAQGSTYGHVFLIEDDIDLNNRPLERNRIKYTAVTRPKNSLYILSRNNYSNIKHKELSLDLQ